MWPMLYLNEILDNVGMVLYRVMLKGDVGNVGHDVIHTSTCMTCLYLHMPFANPMIDWMFGSNENVIGYGNVGS